MKKNKYLIVLSFLIVSLSVISMMNLTLTTVRSQESPSIDFRGFTYELQYLDSTANISFITEQQIRTDLELLQNLNVNHLRTMGTKFGQDLIPEIADEYGMQVATGAWISWNNTDSYLEIDRAINVSEDSELLILGSGAYQRGEISTDQLEDYLEYAAGKTETPITTAESWQFWIENIGIGLLCDKIMIEIDPLVELTQLNDIGGFIESIITSVQGIYSSKEILISVGLPSTNHSLVSETIQKEFYEKLLTKLADSNITCYCFEAFDVPNRQYYTDDGNSGPYWGIFDLNRNPKPVVSVFNEFFNGNIDLSDKNIPGFLGIISLTSPIIIVYYIYLKFKMKK